MSMERLSDTAIEIINELHTERLDYSSEYIPLIDAASRLSAYEDTGLEPEEIADFMKRWGRAVEIAGLCKKGGIDHLLELKKAEKAGRLLVLPCGTDVKLVRDGYVFKADHWNHTLTAFRDAPENKSGMQVALFSIKEAEAALKGSEG